MSAALEALLAGEVTAVALCWRLRRPDGMVLGLTGHDRDIRAGGTLFRSRPGMTPSAASLSAELTPDGMEVEGVLDAEGLTAFDLEAGRWAGAEVELLALDWSQPGAGLLRLLRGRIGDVVRRDLDGGGFRVELVSDAALMEAQAVPRCSPLCRAELGDGRCGVDLGGRWIEAVVAEGGGTRLVLAAAVERAGDHAEGRLRFLSGRLAGVERRILGVEGTEVRLEEPVPDGVVAGALVRLWQGCDRRFETCATRFGNAAAFDGEPHVPGQDALLRYGEP